MSGLQPTDASFECQLINHWATITGNKFRPPEHYHIYAHVVWKYTSVMSGVWKKSLLELVEIAAA